MFSMATPGSPMPCPPCHWLWSQEKVWFLGPASQFVSHIPGSAISGPHAWVHVWFFSSGICINIITVGYLKKEPSSSPSLKMGFPHVPDVHIVSRLWSRHCGWCMCWLLADLPAWSQLGSVDFWEVWGVHENGKLAPSDASVTLSKCWPW